MDLDGIFDGIFVGGPSSLDRFFATGPAEAGSLTAEELRAFLDRPIARPPCLHQAHWLSIAYEGQQICAKCGGRFRVD